MTTKYKWTVRLSLLALPLLFVVVLLMGGGHGTYIPAMGLFPFGLISTVLYNRITIPFVVVGILQYPIYGFIIDKARQVGNSKTIVSILIFLHIAMAILIIILTGENWR